MPIPRRLLACLPAALAPSAARAFRQEDASAELEAAYAESCRGEELHATLREVLAAAGEPAGEEVRARLAVLARCPFCGCAVLGAADHGEATPPPPG